MYKRIQETNSVIKHILILAVVVILGVSVVSAQQLNSNCDPYHIGESDFSVDINTFNTPANEADAAAKARLGINPELLMTLADNVSGQDIQTADFANPAAQLKENDFAVVTDHSTSLKLYAGTCLEAPILAQLQPGTQVTVLDGPIAAEGLAWWRVRRSDLTGWVIEGQGSEIWLHG